MARDFVSVIGDVLGAIPASENRLISALTALRETAKFSAPEVMRQRWFQLEEILMDQIPEPTEDWHRTLSEIITGKASSS